MARLCLALCYTRSSATPSAWSSASRREISPHRQRSQTKRQLVQHQEAWSQHQALGDREHLLLAARERRGGFSQAVFEGREELASLLSPGTQSAPAKMYRVRASSRFSATVSPLKTWWRSGTWATRRASPRRGAVRAGGGRRS